MIKHFISLEWKQYFRSSYWQKGLAVKILLGFFAVYMMVSFLSLGIFSFFIIRKTVPDTDPLHVVNSYLLFAIMGDLIFRYLMQKLPAMKIKPLLVLPIKKKKLVHYVLAKSAISAFNIFGLFFYVPFAIVLMKEGYSVSGALGWLFAMIVIIQSSNFLNFIINKSNIAFAVLATILGGAVALQYFSIFDLTTISKPLFNAIYETPSLSLIPLILLFVFYFINFKILKSQLFLDGAIKAKVKEVNASDLSWVNSFGEMGPFIKNEMRLIWRNKRTKMVFLMSFLFVLYGLIFFTNPIYEEKMKGFLVFASIFVTGGFVLNYGQFIPAWESAYYKMLMTQNLSYRKYIESKWFLMTAITTVLFILATPYLYFGTKTYLMVASGAIFNIGINTLVILYAGSFNRKRIELNVSGIGNTQGTSAKQFIIIIPIMGIPIAIFYLFYLTISYHAGLIAIGVFGILGLLLRNYFMDLIAKKYVKNKYAAISAFEEVA